jgi:hypothetical protein|tara:strand:- start:375 stop:1490 length:1116 start_codon:yes stop_codon:yes gene_type:complete
MKKIMKIVLILFLTIFTVKTANADSNGNNVFILLEDTSGAGAGETIYIRQEGYDNWVGNWTNHPFKIEGTGNTVNIVQIGYTNDFADYSSFDCTNCTLDVNVKGSDNAIEMDMDDTGDSGWWIDIDIRGGDNLVKVSDAPDGTNVANQNYDIDIDGNNNQMEFKVENGSGGNHYLYAYIYGDNNYVDYLMNDNSLGKNTTANAAIGPYNSISHSQVANKNLASIDFYIIGSSNSIQTETMGETNYMLIELFNGSSSNRIDYTPSAYSAGYNRVMQFGDNNEMLLRLNGNSNRIGIYQQGNNNYLSLNYTTSSATLYTSQTGGNNTANVSVTGDSIYDYTLNFTQNGSDTCTYSFNRNTQSADVTATIANNC